jgi:hypothetical protein
MHQQALTKPVAAKAFMVSDDEHSVIQFSQHAVSARRQGAIELGTEFEFVSCRRAPYADAYSESGQVPAKVLLAHGWWQTCQHCASQVSEDGEDENGEPLEPVYEGGNVYCNQGCKDAEAFDRLERAKRKQEVINATIARWPEAKITYANDHDRDRRVIFFFDGGAGDVTWKLGERTVLISPLDLHAYHAWDCRQKALADIDQGVH